MSIEVIAKVLGLTAGEVTPLERLILLVLATASDEKTGASFANPEIIARRTGLPEETVNRIIQNLVQKRFLVATPLPQEDGGGILNHYSLELWPD
jgi:DNA-binding MarR family transcriptional regulator